MTKRPQHQPPNQPTTKSLDPSELARVTGGDAASGLHVGRRQHKPVTLDMELG